MHIFRHSSGKMTKSPNPDIPSPENYGWKLENGIYVPVSCELPAAPDAVVQLVLNAPVVRACAQNPVPVVRAI